jgi:proteasome alpha subunit
MTNYFYVSPEQLTKDRAEFAQKGIARGRSLVAALYDEGVLLVAENPSASLNKISEIYDRIAFAGVGKYNEFDRLREAGIRWADGTGFTYSREDVDARALANYYAQHLGDMFTEGQKPPNSVTKFAPPSSIALPTKERSLTNLASPFWEATPKPYGDASPPPKK